MAVDPQVSLPEERVCVRLEDPVVVTPDGVENLTGFAPRDPDAVERAMAAR